MFRFFALHGQWVVSGEDGITFKLDTPQGVIDLYKQLKAMYDERMHQGVFVD